MAGRFLLPLLLLAARVCAAEAETDPPRQLAAPAAAQIEREARAAGAKTLAVSVSAAPGLEGVPALVAVARTLEERLFGDRALTPAEPGDADLDVALELSRVGGRIALGGAARARGGRPGWVLASAPETPEWAPWLTPIVPPARDAGGFAWRRVTALAGDVLDADGGDLDGDGLAELVAATREEICVFRLDGRAAALIARTGLPPAAPAPFATRAPRAFVRVAPGAGGPGEVLLRFTDEARTRVFVWDAARARLEPRGERDGVVLAARAAAHGVESIAADTAPGTNHFEEPPRVRRGGAWRTPAALSTWLDLREADVTATAWITGAGAAFGLLDGAGALRLLRGDLSELARVGACGSAFALADWDGDGRPEALCAGAGEARGRDRVFLVPAGGGEPAWSAEIEGRVAALAAGPQAGGTAALAFVRDDRAPGTSVWLLDARRPAAGALRTGTGP